MRKEQLCWMTIMLMAFVCVGITACGGDDDDNGGSSGSEAQLVGSWKKIYERDYNSDGTFYESEKPWDEAADGVIVKGDGSCQEVSFAGDLSVERVKKDYTLKFADGHLYTCKAGHTDDWKDRGIWSISGDILTLDKSDNEGGHDIKKYRKIR